MKVLHYILLAFTIWALPSFLLQQFGESVGRNGSYAMFLLLIGYFMLNAKGKWVLPFIFLGLTYYLIAGLNYIADFDDYINKFIKYLVFIIGGFELVKRTPYHTIYTFLLIGAFSVLIHAWFYPDDYGRYSGFYLNPNKAGLMAVFGYGFSFMIHKKSWRYLGFIVFSIAGILTLSRYFILMWLIVSIIAIVYNRKNSAVFGIGFGVLFLVLSISTLLQLNTFRFSVIQDVFENQVNQGLVFLTEGSRFETWSNYYDMILNKPIFGNGFGVMDGSETTQSGVHNTFLLTLGEAGLIPFLMLIGIYLRLLIGSIKNFRSIPYALLLVLANIGYLFVSHNFYDDYLLLFITLWTFYKLNPFYTDLETTNTQIN